MPGIDRGAGGRHDPVGQRLRLLLARQQEGVTQASAGCCERAVGRDPRVEDAARLQRRLQAGLFALGPCALGIEFDQFPEWRPGARHCTRVRRALVGRGWHLVFTKRQTRMFGFQRLPLRIDAIPLLARLGFVLRQPQAGGMLRVLQRLTRGIVAFQRSAPVAQRLEQCGLVGQRQFAQRPRMVLPGRDQGLACRRHRRIGLGGARRRFGQFVRAVVARALGIAAALSGLALLAQSSFDHANIGAALRGKLAQALLQLDIGALRQASGGVGLGQRGGIAPGVARRHAGLLRPRLGRDVSLCQRGARGPCPGFDLFEQLGVACMPLLVAAHVRLRRLHVVTRSLRQPLQLTQAVGILHQRIGLDLVERGAVLRQLAVDLAQPALLLRFFGGGFLEHSTGFVQFTAGFIESGLGRAQHLGLAPRIDARIALVQAIETTDRLCQRLQLGQLQAVFFELAHGLGHVGQQVIGQGRQRFGQRVRQVFFVRFLGQLRLAQLDQRIHQRAIARLAQVEQALVDRAPIRGCGLEHPPVLAQRQSQAVLAQHRALRIDQPQLAADALGLGDEEPAVDLVARRHRRQAAAERQVARRAIFVDAAELDPGVADAPLVLAEQEIPRHALAGIAIRFDPRRLETGVEQEGQGQRQDLRLAGAVIAAQKQVAVVEPEFLAIVVE